MYFYDVVPIMIALVKLDKCVNASERLYELVGISYNVHCILMLIHVYIYVH